MRHPRTRRRAPRPQAAASWYGRGSCPRLQLADWIRTSAGALGTIERVRERCGGNPPRAHAQIRQAQLSAAALPKPPEQLRQPRPRPQESRRPPQEPKPLRSVPALSGRRFEEACNFRVDVEIEVIRRRNRRRLLHRRQQSAHAYLRPPRDTGRPRRSSLHRKAVLRHCLPRRECFSQRQEPVLRKPKRRQRAQPAVPQRPPAAP